MKKWASYLRILVFGIALQAGGLAHADWIYTPGTGSAKFLSFNSATTPAGTGRCAASNVDCTAQVPIDISGTALFSAANSGVVSFPSAQPVSATSLPLPTGAATSALQGTGNTSLASILTALGTPMQASGGSVTSNQGTAAAVANSWYAKLSDGTNGPVAVKAASTAPTATDLALVVSLSPNSAGIVSPCNKTGNLSVNNVTAVVLKLSAGVICGVQLAGLGSAPAYLKFYDATSATCGSGTPVKRLMIPAASTAANGAGSNITFGPQGVNFSTGITYCVTTGITDADTTPPAASTFLINIDWS